MSAEIIGLENDIITVRLSGQLTQADLAALHGETGTLIERLGHVRILVCAENFQGWAAGGTWDDFSFQETYDSRIGRMAIVAAEQWRDLALLFTSNELRSFPIEFFPPERLGDARAWMRED